jgi:hypothetical protein
MARVVLILLSIAAYGILPVLLAAILRRLFDMITLDHTEWRSETLCPWCDEEGGTQKCMGEWFHPSCLVAFQNEYDRVLGDLDEPHQPFGSGEDIPF